MIQKIFPGFTLATASLIAIYLLLAIASIIPLGSVAAIAYLLLAAFSIYKDSRSGFILLFMLYYVPNWCVNVPHIYLVTVGMTFLFNYKEVINLKGIKKLMPVLPLFIVFFLVRAISIGSIYDMDSYIMYVENLIYTLIHIFICANLLKDQYDVDYVLRFWGLIGAMAAILGFLHFYFGADVYMRTVHTDVEYLENGSIGNGYADWVRWIWVGVEPNYYGLSLLIPFAANAYCFFKKMNLFNILLFGLSFLGIFGTYSRSTLLCAILAVCILLVMSKVEHKGSAFTLAVVGLIGILSAFPEFVERILSIQENLSSEGGSGRFALWKSSMQLFWENPLIGIGTGQVIHYAKLTHNSFIQILAENGFLGFIPFLMIYMTSISRALKIRKNNSFFIAVLIAFAINMNTVSCFNYRIDFSLLIMLFTYLHCERSYYINYTIE